MTFWIIAGAMALAAVAILARAATRRDTDTEHPAAYDLRVYRDQLKEVDRDLARGVIGAEDAERTRTEISRRVLAADAQLTAAQGDDTATTSARWPLVAGMGIVIVALTGLAYSRLGAPGYGDMPLDLRFDMAAEQRASRMDQQKAEAGLPPRPQPDPEPRYAELMTRLRAAVAERPDDLQGQELLARNEAAMGNYPAAYRAQAQVIRLKGDAATAEDYTLHANMLISATEGYVSPEAEASLRRALERDPNDLLARYYWGLMQMQTGRPDLAFRQWDFVLRQSPPDAPWLPAVRDRLPDLAWYAGQSDYALPEPVAAPGLSGPSAEDMQAAQDMTPEERQEMIRGMVSQLSERLASEGGTPQEWARLIGAYGVLGDTDRAAAIWEEAQQVFAEAPEALAVVRAGAARAGLVQ